MTDAPLPIDRPSDAAAEHRDDAAPVDPPVRAWWQFSLRTMFVLVTLLVIGLAWFVSGPERQRRAVEAIQAKGEVVWYRVGPRDRLNRPKQPAEDGWIPPSYYLPIEIDLAEARDTDDTLASVASLPTVVFLDLGVSDVTDDGLAKVESLGQVQLLFINGTSISDAGLAHLRHLRKLNTLWLQETAITDAGVASLVELPELEELGLRGTRVTDAVFAHLSRMPALRRVELADTQVTEAAWSAWLKQREKASASHE